MYANTTGDVNTAVGERALLSCTTGRINTAVGGSAMDGVTTGENNTAIGYEAGDACTTGSNNVFLGFYAGRNQGNNDNELWIARGSQGANNAAVWIYGNSNGSVYQGNNQNVWSTTSDRRLKKDIVENTNGLSLINQIKIKNFKYKQYVDGSPVSPDDVVDMSEFSEADQPDQVLIGQGKTDLQLGIIAQELEEIVPDCVETSDKGVKTVNSTNLTWYLINAVKELSAKNDALAAEVEQLKSQLNN